jgi:hypothetical protein
MHYGGFIGFISEKSLDPSFNVRETDFKQESAGKKQNNKRYFRAEYQK